MPATPVARAWPKEAPVTLKLEKSMPQPSLQGVKNFMYPGGKDPFCSPIRIKLVRIDCVGLLNITKSIGSPPMLESVDA